MGAADLPDMEKLERKLELRLYRYQNSVWMFLGFAIFIASMVFLLDEPSRRETAVAAAGVSPTLLWTWNISWGLGAVLIMIGVWWWLSRVEVIGHMLFGGGILVQAIAIFVVVQQFVPSLLISGSFSAASFFRAYYILRFLEKKH